MVAESGGRMMPIERKSKLRFRWWPNFGGDTGLWFWFNASVAELGVDSKIGLAEGGFSSWQWRAVSITHTVSMAGQTLKKSKQKLN